jgi:hypothetical protein
MSRTMQRWVLFKVTIRHNHVVFHTSHLIGRWVSEGSGSLSEKNTCTGACAKKMLSLLCRSRAQCWTGNGLSTNMRGEGGGEPPELHWYAISKLNSITTTTNQRGITEERGQWKAKDAWLTAFCTFLQLATPWNTTTVNQTDTKEPLPEGTCDQTDRQFPTAH